MKKILLLILLIVLVVAGYFILAKGVNVFGIEVLSYKGIKDKNEELEEKLQKVTTLTSTDYPAKIAELSDSSKKLIVEKEAYADMAASSTNEDVVSAGYIEKHNLEHLWVKIGNYATKNGITMKLEITTGTSGSSGEYNLNFTANGSYVTISEFIAALEDDSTLEFKIENFKLVPGGGSDSEGSTDSLQATFLVRDIAIIIDQNKTTSPVTNTTDNNP